MFGAFSPKTGDHFELELPFCDTEYFQVFLNEFSENKPDEFKILLLDNGTFHKTKTLIIPENIALVFIPPYSPELNPAEKIWWKMKRGFTGKLHHTLDNVSDFIQNQVDILTKEQVKSICQFEYIISSAFWTKSY